MSYELEEDTEFTPRDGSFLESVVADELTEEHRWEFESGSVVTGVVTDVAETSESLTVEITLPDDTVAMKEFDLDDYDYVKTILTENDVPIDEPSLLEGVGVPVYFCSDLLDDFSESRKSVYDSTIAFGELFYTDFNTGVLGTTDEEMLEPFVGLDEVTIKELQYDKDIPNNIFKPILYMALSLMAVGVVLSSGWILFLSIIILLLQPLSKFAIHWTAEEVETVNLEQ